MESSILPISIFGTTWGTCPVYYLEAFCSLPIGAYSYLEESLTEEGFAAAAASCYCYNLS